MLTLAQLRAPATRTEALDWALELLNAAGFETTGWQDGRIQKTLVVILATLTSDFTELACDIVEFAFNDFATGEPMNAFSQSRFGNKKISAFRTRGPMRLRSSSSVPYTIQPGELIASTDDGVEFRNVNEVPVVLSAGPGASLVITWEARLAGAAGNVPTGAVRRLKTPLAGVTISNDSGPPWYTTAGADEQSDVSIRQQNATQWSRMNVELVREAYENIALRNGAVKVTIDDQNPRGAGTLDVYVGGGLALLGTTEKAAIQLAFAKVTFATDETLPAVPSSSTSRVVTRDPTGQDLNLAGTIYFDPLYDQPDVAARVVQALQDLLVRVPIGGFKYPPSLVHVVTLGDILEVIENVEGVRTCVLSSPTVTVSVGTLSQLLQGTWNFTYTPVTS